MAGFCVLGLRLLTGGRIAVRNGIVPETCKRFNAQLETLENQGFESASNSGAPGKSLRIAFPIRIFPTFVFFIFCVFL